MTLSEPLPAAEALKFVTHFVGDIHQPLHVSRTSDRGGNSIPVHVDFQNHTAKPRNLRGQALTHHHSNLHGVWDGDLLETFLSEHCHDNLDAFRTFLTQFITDAQASGEFYDWVACADGGARACLDAWAQESWHLATHVAYVHVNGTQIAPDDHLSRDYYERSIDTVLTQLAKASVRLALTLMWSLAQGKGEPTQSLWSIQ